MKKLSVILLVLAAMSMQVFAQQGRGEWKERKMKKAKTQVHKDLNLTPEQQKQIKKLKLTTEKKLLPLKTDLMKAKGELKILKAEDNPSQKMINAKIDLITSLQAKIMKIQAKHKMDFRNILTEEQKLKLEKRKFHGKKHKKHGKKSCGGCR